MILRMKLWIIVLSILLILLDRFSFISRWRDDLVVSLTKIVATSEYKIVNYPHLLLLEHSRQHQLEAENLRLQKQVERDSLLIQQENNRSDVAKELDLLKPQEGLYDEFGTVTARAIINVNYLINSKLLINKGSSNGIKIGDVVINQDGIVGQINVVNDRNAEVTLIDSPDYKIYLQSSKSHSKMLAQGTGHNALLVRYLDKKADVHEGDVLLTTGLDDLYPASLPVAKVTKIFPGDSGFNSAFCTPMVDFNKLQYVLVLKHANK